PRRATRTHRLQLGGTASSLLTTLYGAREVDPDLSRTPLEATLTLRRSPPRPNAFFAGESSPAPCDAFEARHEAAFSRQPVGGWRCLSLRDTMLRQNHCR